ncbi:hypothetical protein P43SY_002511 [Pythium insidiosum]|uniref:Peptidyl-prolyl cis-trans isomerase n=1 Tax=Pythium insidiosum TaxID=114742 RepID=A0AAD5LTK2_PYTIN|nr:hypothetical protein P43SY_002511 [Pythium insidiosum]
MLCTGERKGNAKVRALWYKQSPFHRIIPGFMMQGGDITHGNGAGGASVFTRSFEDESFLYKHQVGSVSMAHQHNSNKSQFFISFVPASWCDGKHVVFGQVLAEDLMHLSAFEAVGSPSGLPLVRVVVTDCGQLSGDGYMAPAAPSGKTS